MAQTDPQVNFRCPRDLKSLLEEAAKQGERSLNAEIIKRLRGSFRLPTDENIVITADSSALRDAVAFALREVLDAEYKRKK